MRVLAIEDNRQFLDLLRSHLVKHGFAVDTAETLESGLGLAGLGGLVARIRAVVRRGPAASRQEQLAYAGLVFDQKNRQAIVNGRAILLRPREAALLEALLRRAGEPIHRELLLSSLYGLDEEIGSNTLDVHVHHLRRRLAEAGARVSIATVRGHGYALRGHDA